MEQQPLRKSRRIKPVFNTPIKVVLREHSPRLFFTLIIGFIAAVLTAEGFGLSEVAGRFLITGLLLLIFYRDILRYKPDFTKKTRMLLLLGLLFLFTLFGARLFQYFFQNFSEGIGIYPPEAAIYCMPLAAGAMMVALIFDFHTAIIFSFITSLSTGLWVSEPAYPIYAFVGSLVGAFSVIKCTKRTDILRGGLYVSLANLFTLIGILLFTNRLFTEYSTISIVYAASSGIVISSIVSLLLPAIESIFKVTTDISLLELLDLNQPIMKNLMITAPGTYHHSIIVGNLVEAVAEDIGVNPLLARVSAYYHDIGKMRMPDYFVENQRGTVSKHDRLTPHMSSMILIAHVKDGVEIAREYKLPEPVIDIIEQHHGTCLMTYFYQKAKDAGNGEPAEEDYRYHGPKPQSRVAALVMLADAVEAASRVLNDPTPARIESLVDKIVNHIFIDGQLEECELTLKDISNIKKKFTYILTGILHRRIDYPGFDFNEKKEKPEKKEKVIPLKADRRRHKKTHEDRNTKQTTKDKNGSGRDHKISRPTG
ncbi:MAG: HDIG domain-containing protein [Nitrospirae bacterium]|nr:MAG: HDIG domain-containing protein [Nitrospirota bacterium]